jgi:hypothetical protein
VVLDLGMRGKLELEPAHNLGFREQAAVVADEPAGRPHEP